MRCSVNGLPAATQGVVKQSWVGHQPPWGAVKFFAAVRLNPQNLSSEITAFLSA